MKTYKSFETERLLLIPTDVNDAAFILELVNTPKWLRFIGNRNINTVEEAEEFIKTKIIPQYEKLGYSNYTLVRKSDKTKLGTCGLYDREGFEGVDIGFALLPLFENKGYAFEAAEKIIDAGFRLFNLKRIYAMTLKENVSSTVLLHKLGFQFSEVVNIPDDATEYQQYILDSE